MPLDLKANSISERNAKERRRFVRSSKKMNKSRMLKKSESNLTDSTTEWNERGFNFERGYYEY